MIEFLSVVGNLTAEILTPGLHLALANTTPYEVDAQPRRSPGDPARGIMTSGHDDLPRVQTGITNLDTILQGGLPRRWVTVVSGL